MTPQAPSPPPALRISPGLLAAALATEGVAAVVLLLLAFGQAVATDSSRAAVRVLPTAVERAALAPVDTDGDGKHDRVDLDDDNDGIGDADDPRPRSYPDGDNDGLLDAKDPDDDNDGRPDAKDKDRRGRDMSHDYNNDGTPDWKVYLTQGPKADLDRDGRPDFTEWRNLAVASLAARGIDVAGIAHLADARAHLAKADIPANAFSAICRDKDNDGRVDYLDQFDFNRPPGGNPYAAYFDGGAFERVMIAEARKHGGADPSGFVPQLARDAQGDYHLPEHHFQTWVLSPGYTPVTGGGAGETTGGATPTDPYEHFYGDQHGTEIRHYESSYTLPPPPPPSHETTTTTEPASEAPTGGGTPPAPPGYTEVPHQEAH